jgi:hypothetical protein
VSFPFNLYIEELLDERKKRASVFRRIRWSGFVTLLMLLVMIFSVMLAKQGQLAETPEIFIPGAGLPRPTEYHKHIEHDYYFADHALEGYEKIDRQEGDNGIRERWTDGTHTLERWQSNLGWRHWRGVQSTSQEDVSVNGTAARIYHLQYDRSMLLVWGNERYFMELRVLFADSEPAVTTEQLIRWAESLTPIALTQPQPDGAE